MVEDYRCFCSGSIAFRPESIVWVTTNNVVASGYDYGLAGPVRDAVIICKGLAFYISIGPSGFDNHYCHLFPGNGIIGPKFVLTIAADNSLGISGGNKVFSPVVSRVAKHFTASDGQLESSH